MAGQMGYWLVVWKAGKWVVRLAAMKEKWSARQMADKLVEVLEYY